MVSSEYLYLVPGICSQFDEEVCGLMLCYALWVPRAELSTTVLVKNGFIKWKLESFATMRVLVFSFQFLILFLDRVHTYG
jgi:hypothetical protein